MNLYAAAVYQWQRSELGVATELAYTVLSQQAHKAWKNDEKEYDLFQLAESMDDFRAGVTTNTAMKAQVVLRGCEGSGSVNRLIARFECQCRRQISHQGSCLSKSSIAASGESGFSLSTISGRKGARPFSPEARVNM